MSESMPFDLDAVEHEAKSEPFRFTLAGEEYEMASPEVADWRTSDLDDVAGIESFMRDLLGDKQFSKFSKNRLPGFKLMALIEAALKYYGVSQGESVASPRSSRRTAKR